MSASGPAEWRLEIADGPNAGAGLALSPGSYRIGRDPGNDIVLSDPAIADEHALVEITATGARLICLQEGRTSIRGRGVAAGRPQLLGATSDIRLGDTLLRVTRPNAAAPARSGRLGACALVGAAVAAVTFIASGGANRPVRPAPMAERAAPPAIETARSALAAQVAGAGLAGLHVNASGGSIFVTGTVPPDRAAAWQTQQAWYDQHYARNFALVSDVRPEADNAPALDIAAVSLAPVANIITRDGEHYTEGAITPDGWSIVSITASAILLHRGTRDVRMTL